MEGIIMNYKKIPMFFLLSLISGLLVHTVAYAPIHRCFYSGCNEFFTRLDLLDTHERWHTGQMPFVCLVEGCSQRFASNQFLIRHMTQAHQQALRNNREWRVLLQQGRRDQERQVRQQELQDYSEEVQKEEK